MFGIVSARLGLQLLCSRRNIQTVQLYNDTESMQASGDQRIISCKEGSSGYKASTRPSRIFFAGHEDVSRAFYQAVDGGEDVVVSVRQGAAGCRLSFELTKKQASVISCTSSWCNEGPAALIWSRSFDQQQDTRICSSGTKQLL
jgi:hypothetical protein